jgi:hypothetical protein
MINLAGTNASIPALTATRRTIRESKTPPTAHSNQAGKKEPKISWDGE